MASRWSEIVDQIAKTWIDRSFFKELCSPREPSREVTSSIKDELPTLKVKDLEGMLADVKSVRETVQQQALDALAIPDAMLHASSVHLTAIESARKAAADAAKMAKEAAWYKRCHEMYMVDEITPRHNLLSDWTIRNSWERWDNGPHYGAAQINSDIAVSTDHVLVSSSGISLGHGHVVNLPVDKLRKVAEDSYRAMIHTPTTHSVMTDVARSVVMQYRQNYGVELIHDPNKEVAVPFSERCHPFITVSYSGKSITLEFKPTKDITAYQMYRVSQLMDGYVPIQERMRFILDEELQDYFHEKVAASNHQELDDAKATASPP